MGRPRALDARSGPGPAGPSTGRRSRALGTAAPPWTRSSRSARTAAYVWSLVALLALRRRRGLLRGRERDHDAHPARALARDPGASPLGGRAAGAPRARGEGGPRPSRRRRGRGADRRARGRRPVRRPPGREDRHGRHRRRGGLGGRPVHADRRARARSTSGPATRSRARPSTPPGGSSCARRGSAPRPRSPRSPGSWPRRRPERRRSSGSSTASRPSSCRS